MSTHPKMRVCLITFAFPPLSSGGVSTQSYELASHLSKAGVEVHVLAAGKKNEQYRCNGLFNVTTLKVPFSSTLMKIPTFQFRVWRWLRSNEKSFDIIHFQGTSGFIYLLSRKNHNVVQTCHHSGLRAYKADLGFILKSPKTTLVYLSGILLALAEILSLRIVQNITTPSNVLRSELLSYGVKQSRITVIPNGVNDVHFGANEKKKTNPNLMKFLFVGRLYPIKGIDTLMKAVNILSKKETNNYHIDIIGDGPLLAYCENQIANNNLQNCSLLGAVSRQEVDKLYGEADCLIFDNWFQVRFHHL